MHPERSAGAAIPMLPPASARERPCRKLATSAASSVSTRRRDTGVRSRADARPASFGSHASRLVSAGAARLSLITIGGCIATEAHGKNHFRDGTFRRSVLALDLFHPAHGVLRLTRDSHADLLELTCGGLGLTGQILSATLKLDRLEGTRVEIRRVPLGRLEEAVPLLEQWAPKSRFLYTWHNLSVSGASFGRGFLYTGDFLPESGSVRGGEGFRPITAEAAAAGESACSTARRPASSTPLTSSPRTPPAACGCCPSSSFSFRSPVRSPITSCSGERVCTSTRCSCRRIVRGSRRDPPPRACAFRRPDRARVLQALQGRAEPVAVRWDGDLSGSGFSEQLGERAPGRVPRRGGARGARPSQHREGFPAATGDRRGVLRGVRILPAVASGLRSASPVPFGNLGTTRAMTCVVVGASSGLGRALAEELARMGRPLVLVSSDARDLLPIASDLPVRFGGPVRTVAADAAEHAGLAASLDRPCLRVSRSRLSCFPWERSATRRWAARARAGRAARAHEPVSVSSVVGRLLPRLISQGSGTIVGFGSVAALRGRSGNVQYAAAKRALESYFESLRHLGRASRARRGVLCPGVPRHAAFLRPQALAAQGGSPSVWRNECPALWGASGDDVTSPGFGILPAFSGKRSPGPCSAGSTSSAAMTESAAPGQPLLPRLPGRGHGGARHAEGPGVLDELATEYEVIIVDDGSPDRAGEIADGFAPPTPASG